VKQRVRDAGVAGSNPATPTKKSLGFLPFFPSAFKANHRFSHRNPVWLENQRLQVSGVSQPSRSECNHPYAHVGRRVRKICYFFSAASAKSSHSAAILRNIARDFSSSVAVAKR
jgi:hypothetical protein